MGSLKINHPRLDSFSLLVGYLLGVGGAMVARVPQAFRSHSQSPHTHPRVSGTVCDIPSLHAGRQNFKVEF